MPEPAYLTQHEAADLCGRSYDTIRRRRAAGALPNSRTRADGAIEVAVADLVAAGLLDPIAATHDAPTAIGRSRAERELAELRATVSVLETRNELLDRTVADQKDEIAFLRAELIAKRVA